MKTKERLDLLKSTYNTKQFIEQDPIQFAHQFSDLKNIEVVAFLVATITWGKRPMILKSATKMLKMMGGSPYDFIMKEQYASLGTQNIHRTFFEQDFVYFCKGLREIYSKQDSIQPLFSKAPDLWQGIIDFRNNFVLANDGIDSKHISNPEKKSACKRLHMGLRWLVRDDGIVDLGVWKDINPSALFIPLDTHVARISRELGLLTRKSNDKQSVVELTEQLRLLDSNDPIGYDFALFGWGEDGGGL